MSTQCRDFLRLTAAVSVTSVLPLWSRTVLAASRPALLVLTLLTADARSRIALTIQAGKTQFDALYVTTWGYNGSLLGPALQLTQGKTIAVDITNQLAEEIMLYWHGLEVPDEVDDGPRGIIAPGATRTVSFVPTWWAATRWFYPYQHGTTGRQVAMRLADLVLIEDEEGGRLLLPKQWGIDDAPMIAQDKKFTAADEIGYQLDMMSTAVDWFGDTLLTNGAFHPEHAAPRGWLRLRLLDGCNARSLNFVTSDKHPLYVVASDGDPLVEPVKIDELPVLMGECFKVLVGTSDGKPFDLVALPASQMGMAIAPFDKPQSVLHIQPLVIPASGKLLDTLATLPALPPLTGPTQHRLRLSMDPMLDRMGVRALMRKYGNQAIARVDHGMMGYGGMSGMSNMYHGDMSNMSNMNHEAGQDHGVSSGKEFDFHNTNRIDGRAFNMNVPTSAAARGQYEHQVISGKGDTMLHSFHIHGIQFRILNESGKSSAAHRSGWENTVRAEGDVSETLVRFGRPAPKEFVCMTHCHLLGHEDTGIMLGFTV